jgi:hypothetical protein
MDVFRNEVKNKKIHMEVKVGFKTLTYTEVEFGSSVDHC